MLITVTGATGRTGRQVVTGLLAAGHSVRGVVRSDAQASELDAAGAVPVLGDLTSIDLAALLRGSDALVHAAAASNPAPGASDAVDRAGTVALVDAAADAGVRRMVQVSSLYADRPAEGPPFLHEALRAKGISDAALQASSLVWTVVRPGGLIDDEPTGRVAAAARLPGRQVSRADVAAVCVSCLTESATERRAFDLTSGDQPIVSALRGLAPR